MCIMVMNLEEYQQIGITLEDLGKNWDESLSLVTSEYQKALDNSYDIALFYMGNNKFTVGNMIASAYDSPDLTLIGSADHPKTGPNFTLRDYVEDKLMAYLTNL